MPLKTLTKKALKEGNVFEISEIDILAKSNQVRLYWSAGINEIVGQDENGNDITQYVEVDNGNHTVSAESLGKLKPDGAKTWHENLKAVAYQILIDSGIFPQDGELV